jgi:hypothetical protein
LVFGVVDVEYPEWLRSWWNMGHQSTGSDCDVKFPGPLLEFATMKKPPIGSTSTNINANAIIAISFNFMKTTIKHYSKDHYLTITATHFHTRCVTFREQKKGELAGGGKEIKPSN